LFREFAGSKPNHLVLAVEETVIEPDAIVRGCRIRCFAPDEEVSAPYCYGGTGDCFFVTECHVSKPEHKFIPYPEFYVPFNQGFDLNNKPIGDQKPLAGMDLYCGGGNFGRGLEEGGAIQNKWAVDYEAFAVHTYSKNMLHDTAVYYGSVNDFLKAGLTGEYQTGGKKNPYLVPKLERQSKEV
jgi:DNA (cytosine-5)-methyltransferase 1